jgi:hypothetical protein
MRNSGSRVRFFWTVFTVGAVAWLVFSLRVAPDMSGEDVYIFRDAGWNLASYGSFESAALVYMPDLAPRLNSHYTPMMPLLFAGYASIFPRNAYAGTIFNLLLGLLAAGVSLHWVLLQPEGKLRNPAAWAIALLPIAFVTYDRPEALALVLFSVCVALAARPGSRPVLAGLSIALVFLAHPFAAIAATVWVSAIFLARNWNREGRWRVTAGQLAVAGVCALLPLTAVALVYYALDHDSLARFAAHSLGRFSGIHTVESGGWQAGVHKAAFRLSAMRVWDYLASLASGLLLAAWAIRNRSELHFAEWLAIAAAIACMLIAVFLFSIQANYVFLLAFLIPVGLLIVSGEGGRLAAPGLALILFAVLIRLPGLSMDLIERVEQIPSYQAARTQPAFLRAQLSSPDDIVAVEGDSYDLFKPEFRHLIRVEDVDDVNQFKSVAAVANCYDAFHGGDHAVRPLIFKLNPADFHMIQSDPQHAWITLFGRRVMRAQWGFGCDLYVRNGIAAAGDAARLQ